MFESSSRTSEAVAPKRRRTSASVEVLATDRIASRQVRAFGARTLQEEKRVVLYKISIARPEKLWPETVQQVKQAASPEILADPEVALACLQRLDGPGHWALRDAFRFCEKHVLLPAVRQDARLLQCASRELRADRDVVLAAVGQIGIMLQYACPDLRADWDVAITALSNMENELEERSDDRTLKFASRVLRANKALVFFAVDKNGSELIYASKELREDKDVVLKAVSRCGFMLEHVSKKMQADKDIAVAAMSNAGALLEILSREQKADKDIVLAAVSDNGFALEHAGDELRADRDIVLAAVTSGGPEVLEFVSRRLLKDKDLMLLLARRSSRTDGSVNQVYLQVDTSLQQEVSWEMFQQAHESTLAIPGQPENAPALTVKLEKASGDCGESFLASATLLSGEELSCEVPAESATRKAILEDLAMKLLAALPKRIQTADPNHIFLHFNTHDCDCHEHVPVTVWDSHRSLNDFVFLPP